MKNNVKLAKELVRIAKSLVALDDEYDGAGIWHDPGAMREKYEQEELDEAEKKVRNTFFIIKKMVFGESKHVRNFIM